MTRCAPAVAAWGFLVLAAAAAPAWAAPPTGGPFDGEWRTSAGVVTLKQTGGAVTGTYGNAGQFTLKGLAKGKKLTFEYHEAQATGDATWTLDDTGHAFTGTAKVRGGRAGQWSGWR